MFLGLSSLTVLFLLVAAVGHVSAIPVEDVLTPTGVPATSGLPFTTISFDTTANPSVVSALSSFISSESTAVTPYTSHFSMPTSLYTIDTSDTVSSSPTQSTATTSGSSTSTSSTSGARSVAGARWGIVASVVLGATSAVLVIL